LHEVDLMAKMKKTQEKNLLKSIAAKAGRLWSVSNISTVDYIAIDKIVSKYLKKL